ncbi:hypothetical protein [Clostridium beijerinckii]|uniref:hypothetical protein n=1 Tax=Clostridium beijerinckii TaxID=1520 RepID=UPI001F436227|nr:hypothetical protein [Clostridium beijerinckii]
MQKEQELLEQFNKENINVYRLTEFIETENKIKLDGIEELIRFAHDNNINNMFYFYYYLKGHGLLIDEQVINRFHLDSEVLTILKDEIMEYNIKISKQDYSKPVGVIVYCMYNGMILEVEDNDCIVGVDIEAPEDACKRIIDSHLEEIALYKEKQKNYASEERKKLAEQILNDKEFHKCTNVSLRTTYATKVIRKNDVNRRLFMKDSGEWYDIPINDFIELLWREYKELSRPDIITELPCKK